MFVYTLWLKRTSSRNIVIGGAAGAVPTLIGWSSVTGTLDWAPVILFAIIFYWTPPHFWALAIRYRDDYAAAEVPMLPVVESLHRTSVRILGYTLLLWALTVLFSPVAGMGHLYLGSALVLGGIFTWYAVRLLRMPDPGLGVAAPGGAARGRGAGHRHAPVHLVDHLHHAAVRGHGGRPAGALRMVIARRRLRVRRFEGGRGS